MAIPSEWRSVKMKSCKKLAGVFISMLLLLMLTPVTIFAEGQTGSTYIVKRGDCLSLIAKNTLHDAGRWKEIYELNKSSIANPERIYTGQVLIIPADEAVAANVPAQSADEAVAANVPAQPAEEYAGTLAREKLARAALEEPLITAILRQMESDACSLQGLDSRLKSEESLTRKIQTDAAADGITEDEAAAKIADVLRYTLCIREDEYAATVKATLQKLTDAGCSVIKFKNTWGGFGYKGINSQLKTPGGYVFELQFHTPASYNAKEEAHKNYEAIRDPATSPEERNRLEEFSRDLFRQVPVPDGATELSWNVVTK